MTVEELIVKLQKLPPKAKVRYSTTEGCSECNPESIEYHSEIEKVEFKEVGDWPYHESKNIVIIS